MSKSMEIEGENKRPYMNNSDQLKKQSWIRKKYRISDGEGS